MTAPPAGPAIGHEPTRAALAVHARRPAWFLAGAVGAGALGAVLVVAGGSDRLWTLAFSVGGAGLILAVWFGLRFRWMGRVLRTSPWVARRGRHHVTGFGRSRQATILIEADEHGPEVMGAVPEGRAIATDITSVDGPLDLWLAGDPREGAVVSVDGSVLAPLKESSSGWWRRHLRARIAKRESGERPDLHRPT